MSFWASIKPKEEKKQGPYIAPTLPTTDNSTVPFRDATAKGDIIGTAKTTGTLAKAVGQGIMREGAALSSFAFPGVGPLTPTGPVQEAIYGTDKPITLTSFGRETRFADPQGESKGFWKTFDPALGLLVGVLDVMPGGKPTKSLITTFAKETSQAKIADDLAKLAPKLAPDTVWGLAGKLAAETSEAEVRSILQNADIIPPVKNVSTGVTDYDLADNKITYGEKGWKRNELTETTGGKTTVIREEEKIMDVAELPPELKNRYVEALRNKDAARGKGIEEAKAAGKNFQEVVNDIADHLGLREKNAPTPTTPVKVADEAVPPPVKNVSKGVTGRAKIENIQNEDLDEMVDFIDSVRKERVPHPGNSISVRRLAERYGINPEQSDARLANVIQNKIEATPSLRERVVNRTPRRDVDAANPRNYKSAEEYIKAQQPSKVKLQSATAKADYMGGHEAPMADGNAPIWDLSGKFTDNAIYPDDFYTHGDYYRAGTDYDGEAISIMQSLKNRPNARVTVYRAIPKDVKDRGLNTGDWITTTRQYAKEHGEDNLAGNYKIVKQEVFARDIFTDGNSIHEFGYDPQPRLKPEETPYELLSKAYKEGKQDLHSQYQSQLTDIWKKANKTDPLLTEAKGKSLEELEYHIEYHGTKPEYANKILKEGFKVGGGQKGVSTTQDFSEALDYAGGNPENVIAVYVKNPDKNVGTAGVDFLSGTGSFAPEELIPLQRGQITKSQLTDIWKKANKTDPLLTEAKKYTGKPVEYAHNPNRKFSADFSKQFATDIEPAGKYVTLGVSGANKLKGVEYGKVTFNKPLVLEWKTSREGGWKTDLSNMYGGKTGKELSEAIRKDGYDAIVTTNKGNPSEAVILTDIWNKANKKTTPASVLREGQPNLGVQMVKNKDGEFVSIETVVARDRFNIPNLKKLSFGGSDRDVYDLGDGNVLKVAKSARGLDQNVMADWYAADVGLIPNIIEKGKNYIVFEKVGAPDAKTKAMVAELKKLDTYLLSAESHPKHWDEQQKAYNVMAKYGYPGEELGNFGKPLWGDLTAIRNWGTKDGRPVLLDEGSLDGGLVAKHTEWVKDAEGYRVNRTKSNLGDPEFRDIYEASRRAKKRFGDTDSKTMYGGVLAGVQDTDGDGKPDDINPLMAALGVAGMGALRKTTATPNQMSQAGRLVDDLVPPGGGDIPPTTAAQAGKISDTLSSSKTVAQKFKTVFTNIVEHVQNSEERVRQLVTRKDLNTATDPYEIMTLYHGRVGRKIEEGYQRAEEIADDIISFSGRNKTDVLNGRQEVNDYLQALHAGERNAAHGEGAAGMTTAEAAEILKKASPEVKAVAKKALDLNNKTLDLLKDSGVITPELYTTLRTKYKNHVPLQRVMDEQDDIGAVLSGRGFDVRSTGVKAAKGSDRQVADILTNIVNNYEQAVLRSEKNIVDTATLKFVRNNADDLKNIAGVRKPRAVGTRFDTPRKVEELQGMEWETPFTPNEINDALGQAEMEVLTQMELSTAGRRNFIPQADTMDYKVERQASSFPDWVPEHLREKDLFDKVINQYNKGIAQRANATKQKELYDVVQSEIASRVPMDVRDEMALTEIAKQSEVRASLVEKVKAKKGATIFESTNDPKILQLFEEGKPVWIEFKDEKLAIAFRGVGREKLGVLLNGVGAFTRFYSGLATRFNPEFALPNKIRDLQETMTFLASQGDVGFKGAAKTAVVDPASMKAVLDGVRGADTPGAKLYNEMRSLGGTTGGMGLSTRKQTQLNIDKIFNIASSRPRQAAQKLVEYVDNWNTIFEDSTRLSVYKIALEKGATKERAAFLAKEASINFNRSGRGGPVLNALWMFSNASIQGSTKMIRAMKNPKVAAAVGATIMGSVAAVSEWNDRVDPDWRDKVTKWDRINGLPIVLPTEDGSTRYMVIPISWGLKPILVMSNAGYDSVSGVDVDPLDATQRILSSFIDAYNPVGGTDLTSAVTPTILDAPVEVARNQSWSGSLIRPIPYNNEPKDIQYFQSLADTKQGRIAIDTTKKLQENYGILMSPADVDYVITQYIGGAGRSIKKTNEVLYGLSSDDPMPPADEWPFVSRFLRMRTSEETGQGAGGEIEKLKNSLSDQARERFQTNEEAEATYKTMKDLPQEVAAERFEILKETNPTLADKIVEIAKDEKKGLTYEDKLVKALGVENGERARYILEQFNKEKSDEAKAALWEEYQTKGLITKQVSEQLRYLLNQ